MPTTFSLVLALVSLSVACASRQPEPNVGKLREDVKLGESAPANCKKLGGASGSAGGGPYLGDTQAELLLAAQDELRVEARKLGGNFVVMDEIDDRAELVTVSGRVFLCGAPAAPAAPAANEEDL